jgi:segregation and condensation protein B
MDDISREPEADVTVSKAQAGTRRGRGKDLAEASDESDFDPRSGVPSEDCPADLPESGSRISVPEGKGMSDERPPDSDLEDLEGDQAPELKEAGEVARTAMAVMLTSRESLTILRLAQVCNSSPSIVEQALQELDELFAREKLPFELVRNGESARLLTAPRVFPYLKRLRAIKKAERLSPAALETLAVVAYRQPVIRAEVEAIRGVKAGPTLRSLLEHRLIRVTGRADVPGRPLQYGTTKMFLERFGLSSLKDLPSMREFKQLGG